MFSIKKLSIFNGTTDLLHPLWATGYEGLDVYPQTTKLALFNTLGYYEFTDKWQSAPEPVFYTVDQMRQYLRLWYGEIGFVADVEAGTVHLGVHIEGDQLEYIMDFALHEYLQISINLIRWGNLVDSQVALPEKINPERVQQVMVQAPGQMLIPAKLIKQVIYPEQEMLDGAVRLIMEYTPLLAKMPSLDFYQISEQPCILIDTLAAEDYKHIGSQSENCITIAPNLIKTVSIPMQYNQRIGLSVIGEQKTDIRTIASQLIQRVYLTSKIHLKPFDENVFVQITSDIDYNARLSNFKGDVKICTIEALLIGLLLSA